MYVYVAAIAKASLYSYCSNARFFVASCEFSRHDSAAAPAGQHQIGIVINVSKTHCIAFAKTFLTKFQLRLQRDLGKDEHCCAAYGKK
jgi:hypothetical protein